LALWSCSSSTGSNGNGDDGNQDPAQYQLNVDTDPSDGGSTDPASGTYDEGTEVTVDATANEGYSFSEWTEDIESSENPLTFTITSDTDLTANFDQQTTEYTLTTTASPSQGGSISPSNGTYSAGSEVTVEANPNNNWSFTGWSGDTTTSDNPLTFTITEDSELTANFEEQTAEYSLTTDVNPNNAGSVDPSGGTYQEGSQVTVEALPNEGWQFDEWTGDLQSTSNPLSFTIDSNTDLTANFTKATHKMTTTADPSEGGSVTPSSGTYEHGTDVTIEATSNKGWEFAGWSGDLQSNDNPLTFTLNEDTDLKANFEDQRSVYTVELMVIDSKETLDISFGQQQGATQGFDDGIDEEAPPAPPGDALHAYFATGELDLFKDFRSNLKKQVAWNLNYQLGRGSELTLEWDITTDKKTPGTLILTDSSNSFEVDMFTQKSHTVSGSSGKLLIKYKVE
jgi:uncharacterized repeat protein (TIGR02543 family)